MTAKSPNISDEIFEIKSDYSHSIDRIAEALALSRRVYLEHQQEISSLHKELSARDSQISSLTLTASSCDEMKHLLTELQKKYITLLEEHKVLTAKYSEGLSSHLSYVEHQSREREHLSSRVRKLEATAKYMAELAAENTELAILARAKRPYIFSLLPSMRWTNRLRERISLLQTGSA